MYTHMYFVNFYTGFATGVAKEKQSRRSQTKASDPSSTSPNETRRQFAHQLVRRLAHVDGGTRERSQKQTHFTEHPPDIKCRPGSWRQSRRPRRACYKEAIAKVYVFASKGPPRRWDTCSAAEDAIRKDCTKRV